MTITTQDLIFAAKAIGILDTYYWDEQHSGIYILSESESFLFDPERDKSQLMDLQWGLGIGANFDPMIGESFIDYFVQKENRDTWKTKSFENDNFESFATAIILAAAEIGRGMK